MIAIASDHAGYDLKQVIMKYLDECELAYHDFGTYSKDSCNYPEYGLLAANAVASGEYEKGILCCGTGVGISISANKVHGIRCVCCSDTFSAAASRAHNDSNMLALGGRVVGAGLALQIVESWLSAAFEGGRHQKRIDQITEIEQNGTIGKH